MRSSDWSSDVCSSDLIAANPSELAGLGLTLFDRRTQGWFTSTPKTKLILGANFESGPFTINVKETRYDKFKSLDNLVGGLPVNDQSFGAKWITDLEVSYGVTEKFRVAAGAYNLFAVYPDRKIGRAQCRERGCQY